MFLRSLRTIGVTGLAAAILAYASAATAGNGAQQTLGAFPFSPFGAGGGQQQTLGAFPFSPFGAFPFSPFGAGGGMHHGDGMHQKHHALGAFPFSPFGVSPFPPFGGGAMAYVVYVPMLMPQSAGGSDAMSAMAHQISASPSVCMIDATDGTASQVAALVDGEEACAKIGGSVRTGVE